MYTKVISKFNLIYAHNVAAQHPSVMMMFMSVYEYVSQKHIITIAKITCNTFCFMNYDDDELITSGLLMLICIISLL